MTLEWRAGEHGAHHGYAGRVRLFSVQWGMTRTKDKPYVLYCKLPGYDSKTWRCADISEGERKSAAIWKRWLEAVGVMPCPHNNVIGGGHGQDMQCDDCGYVFPEVPS